MPQPLPSPFMPTAGPVLNALRMGQKDRLATQQRSVLKQAGQLAAQGSLGQARKSLLSEGMLAEAEQIGQMIRQANADQLGKTKRTFDVLGNLARAADTPEKWQQAIQAAASAGMDVSKYQDFGVRDLVLAQANKVNEQLDYELKSRGLDLKQQALDQKGAGGGVKPPSGYTWAPDGQSLQAIPGGPATKLPSGEAARIAAAQTAQESLPTAREVYKEQGLGDRINQLLNRGDTGRAERTIRLAVESALRAMTGAAAPESEVKQYMELFAPSVTDGAATRKDKLDRLESFIRNIRANLEQGRGPAVGAPPQSAQPQQQAPAAGSPTPLPEMSDDDLLRELGIE